MKLFPAIDLLGGSCVRLLQGDYSQTTNYSQNPVEVAQQFADEGAEWIHIVDLDAAKSGRATNSDAIARICERLAIPVQVGGGVRTVEAAKRLAAMGVSRVIVGTAAITEPSLLSEIAKFMPVVAGIDGRNGVVAIHGWTESSDKTVLDVASQFAESGVAAIVFTEINRDGTLLGPDLAALAALLEVTEVPVIASGGVGTLDHLTELIGLESTGRSLTGVIVGKAIYEGHFTVSEALAALNGASR